MTNLIDVSHSLHDTEDSRVIERVQSIPQSYIDRLKAERDASKEGREKDYMRVASVPVVLVEKWLAEGYDVYNEPIRKTVAKLKAEGLDHFVTTNKQV